MPDLVLNAPCANTGLFFDDLSGHIRPKSSSCYSLNVLIYGTNRFPIKTFGNDVRPRIVMSCCALVRPLPDGLLQPARSMAGIQTLALPKFSGAFLSRALRPEIAPAEPDSRQLFAWKNQLKFLSCLGSGNQSGRATQEPY